MKKQKKNVKLRFGDGEITDVKISLDIEKMMNKLKRNFELFITEILN